MHKVHTPYTIINHRTASYRHMKAKITQFILQICYQCPWFNVQSSSLLLPFVWFGFWQCILIVYYWCLADLSLCTLLHHLRPGFHVLIRLQKHARIVKSRHRLRLPASTITSMHLTRYYLFLLVTVAHLHWLFVLCLLGNMCGLWTRVLYMSRRTWRVYAHALLHMLSNVIVLHAWKHSVKRGPVPWLA